MSKRHSSNFVFFLKDIPNLNVEHAVEAIGGSEDTYGKMMRQVVRFIPSHIEQMDKYFNEDNDLASFGAKLHGIKGSLLQAGYYELAKTAGILETEAKQGNRQICEEHYDTFKQELQQFYILAKAASQNAEREASSEVASRPICSIKDYINELERAKVAADEYDSLLAAECLSPLTKLRFGGTIDELLAAAIDKAEIFEPTEALPFIERLLSEAKGSE